MNIRNEIKAQIVRAGFTMQEIVDLLRRTVMMRIGQMDQPSMIQLISFIHSFKFYWLMMY